MLNVWNVECELCKITFFKSSVLVHNVYVKENVLTFYFGLLFKKKLINEVYFQIIHFYIGLLVYFPHGGRKVPYKISNNKKCFP